MESKSSMSLIQKIISIFWSPTEPFKSLKENVNWVDIVIPLLLVVIVGWITVPYVAPISTKVAQQRIENNENLSEQQKEQSLESIEKSTGGPLKYIMVIIGTALNAAILALVMWLAGNMFLKGEVEYTRIFAMTAYISLIGIIASAVRTPLMVSQGTTEVYTGAAILFEKSKTFFFRLMKQIDVFSIWKVILFGLGLGTLYKSEKNKALYLTFGLWAIWIIVMSVLGGLNPMA